jgi:hypothetical protein
MGIEKFYKGIIESEYMIKNDPTKSSETNFFYIDFNSIMYNISSKIDDQLNTLLYRIIEIESINNSNKLQSEKTQLIGKIYEEVMPIAEDWNFDVTKANINSYTSFFKEDIVDKKAIELIKKNLEELYLKHISSKTLKIIYIAVDGVPNMAKIVEQKRRRYTGYIISKMKKEIYNKHKTKGTVETKRMLYEETKKTYDRSKIGSHHIFMKILGEELSNESYIKHIKKICPNLETYIVSGPDVPGEGEKKIMEHIIQNKLSGKYTIYSPDGDVIILSMILKNQVNESSVFNILRYDQDTDSYDFVSVNLFMENLIEYITNSFNDQLGKTNLTKLNNKSICNDLALIFTFFGNDFVPRIDSINVKSDMEVLMDIYVTHLVESVKTKSKFIYVTYHDGKYKINYNNLLNLFGLLANREDNLIKESFIIEHTFHKFYRRVFNNPSSLYESISKYMKKLNELHIDIFTFAIDLIKYKIKRINEVNKGDQIKIKKLKDSIEVDISFKIKDVKSGIKNIINKYFESNFAKHIFLLEKYVKKEEQVNKMNEDQTKKKFEDYVMHILNGYLKKANEYEVESYDKINDIMNKYKKNQIKFELAFTDRKFRVPVQDYIKNATKRIMGIKVIEPSEYDYELFKLEWKVGVYEKLLNAKKVPFGHFTIDKDTYKLKSDIDADRKTFYDMYFNAKINDEQEIKKIVNEYFRGLLWVFDFYFNQNNQENNFNTVSTWFYPYHKSPLIKEVYNILKNDITVTANNLINSINTYNVSRDKFFTKREQYLYITPMNNIKERDVELEKLFEKKDLYVDLDIVADKILEGKGKKVIDCRGATFLAKCTLKTVKDYSFNDYIKKLGKDRSHFSDKENNKIVKDAFVYKFNKNYIGGNLFNKKKLYYAKNLFKKKYLENKNIDDKQVYKYIKKVLNED